MSNLTSKAMVAKVDFGFTQIDGLMLPNGSYAISAQQANKFLSFSVHTNNTAKTLRTILGIDQQSIQKTKTDTSPKAENVLSLTQFNLLVVRLAFKGNKTAQAFLEAAALETIERRFDTAFGVEVNERERNDLLKARIEGIMTRRTLTDAIKDYGIRNDKSEGYKKFVYSNVTECLNKALFGKTAKELQADRNCQATRDGLVKKEIIDLDHCERTAMLLVDRRNVEPLEAMKQAVALYA